MPYASLSPVTAGHTLTATSASKAWNLPGLKCAQVILSNDADRATWARLGLLAEHGAANLGVVANTAAYAEGGPWLAAVLDHLDGTRALLAEWVAELLPGVGYTPPEGTYLAWLDFRATGPADPAAHFLAKAGRGRWSTARCAARPGAASPGSTSPPRGRSCAGRSSRSPPRCPRDPGRAR